MPALGGKRPRSSPRPPAPVGFRRLETDGAAGSAAAIFHWCSADSRCLLVKDRHCPSLEIFPPILDRSAALLVLVHEVFLGPKIMSSPPPLLTVTLLPTSPMALAGACRPS